MMLERKTSRRLAVAETGRRLLSKMSLLSINNERGSRLKKFSSTHSETSSTSSSPDSEPTLWEADREVVDILTARKPGIIPNMWTVDEDKMLREAVKVHGEKNWRVIAKGIPHRTHLQCLQRWKKALRPGLVKGHWTKEEDEYLLKLMKESQIRNGKYNWADIASNIDGRNAKQCRERWNLNLDPSINRSPWTDDEDALLMKLHVSYGGRWSLIAKGLNGRTENAVKTRYHSLQRKQIRLRGWFQDEDETLIQGVLMYGRQFGLFSRLLPGRSRGQLKKRFAILEEKNPELKQKVEDIETRIKNGYKPPPIHDLVTMAAEKRKRNTEMRNNMQFQQKHTKQVHEPFVQPTNMYNQQSQYPVKMEKSAPYTTENYRRYTEESELNQVQRKSYESFPYSVDNKPVFHKAAPIKRSQPWMSNDNETDILNDVFINDPAGNVVTHSADNVITHSAEDNFYEVDSSTYPMKSSNQSTKTTGLRNSQMFLDKLLNSIQVEEYNTAETGSSNDENDNDYIDSGYESPLSATDSFPDVSEYHNYDNGTEKVYNQNNYHINNSQTDSTYENHATERDAYYDNRSYENIYYQQHAQPQQVPLF